MGWGLGIVSAILAASVLLVLWVGYKNRVENPDGKAKGIGWQFIRYTVLAIAIPVTALLALNGALTEGAAAIIAGAMGYAFGKPDGREQRGQGASRSSRRADLEE